MERYDRDTYYDLGTCEENGKIKSEGSGYGTASHSYGIMAVADQGVEWNKL